MIGAEHDGDFMALLDKFRVMIVWPHEVDKISATCRLERERRISVRRIKRPDTCYMIVTPIIPQ